MRYLSGIQPSGTLHLGNYFGAMRRQIDRQDGNECYYFIADYHALTTVRNPDELRKNVLGVALDYLAVGLDPARTVFFRQSDVPEVLELAWVLSTLTPMGLLERCHSYKDKVAKGIEASHGLFAYPVLMAADIVIHDIHRVPVGQDQKQHLEVTRDIAQRFNHVYGETLVVPEAEIEAATAVVPGTDGEKMSKSYGNTIEMFAPEGQLRTRVMKITTDSRDVPEPKDPDTSTIFKLYLLMATPVERDEMARKFREGNYGYGDAKKELLRKILEHFGPARARREALARDPAHVMSLLEDGGRRARAQAQRTIDRVYRKVGLR
ncbi:MAG TPA: tryptophan--tRNA ligase [Planctomycetota bacterium]|nr:tryptophan--tRNA ligase [Planctomycetota bacterium]